MSKVWGSGYYAGLKASSKGLMFDDSIHVSHHKRCPHCNKNRALAGLCSQTKRFMVLWFDDNNILFSKDSLSAEHGPIEFMSPFFGCGRDNVPIPIDQQEIEAFCWQTEGRENTAFRDDVCELLGIWDLGVAFKRISCLLKKEKAL